MLKVHHKPVNRIEILLLFCIAFFAINITYCQSLDQIKNVDTAYIYFDKSKKNSIREESLANEKNEFYKNYITYSFNPHPSSIIFFNSNTYKNTDNMRKNIKNDVRTEKKSFLKKNKDIILDYAFFERNGFKETFFALYKKTIYLIDKDEIKGRKVKVKQVNIACYTCFTE